MRAACGFVLAVGLIVAALGCGERVATYDGPKVNQFTGQLVHNGQRVSFPASETVQLKVIHDKGTSYNIPIAADGSFTIGWMPIGKYVAQLLRNATNGKGGAAPYGVPDGLTIVDGKTDYTIELGKGYKP